MKSRFNRYFMQQNLQRRSIGSETEVARNSAEKFARMHQQLQTFMHGLLADAVPVLPSGAARAGDLRGEGHFHLVPELFLQISGSSRFVLPHGMLVLGPGEALVLPPRVLHAETAIPADAPFCNLVVYAN